MPAMIAKKLIGMVLVILAVTFLTFAAMNTLGDPLVNILGPQYESTQEPELIAQVKADYNIDDPLPVRWAKWLGDAVQGDFGRSFSTQQSISKILADKLPVTIKIMVFAQVIAVMIAIPWAVIAASRANKPFDNISTGVSFGLLALPNFALAVILLWLFVKKLGWIPSPYDPSSFGSEVWSLFLPSLTLGLGLAAAYQRLLRTDLITTFQDDFILMAKSKGVPRRRLLYVHALRPSLLSLITVLGINTAGLIGGTIVLETVFSIPGMGREIVEAIIRDDFLVVLSMVAIIASGFVVINVAVDLIYSWLDPRIRE